VTTPPPYYGPPPGQPVGPPGGQQNTQGLVGMILGIVAIPMVCCFYIGVPIAIAGAVFSWLGLQKTKTGLASNRGQAVAGLACSGVAILFAIVLVILSVVAQSFDWQTWIENNSNT
jgi:hypothetical protein